MKQLTKKLEHFLEIGGVKKDVGLLIISGLALALSFLDLPLPFHPAWVAIVLCGFPILMEAFIGLVTAFDIKADVLVSLALIASVCIGEDFAAGEVAFIMQVGSLLEELTVARARAGIEKLVHLTPQTARIVTDGTERVVPAEEVQVGDLLRVLPGESVPVDGIITAGQTSINQAVMTGESLPVDKGAGDEVSSGTVNQFGAFTMRATRVGEDSSIQRMIQLVRSADAGKAKIVALADRWATWVVVIALTAAALTWLLSGKVIQAVTILVVFCPCALVLATPTAIMAAIGNATKHGFLVRQGDALERLAKVSRIAFDKTGTLTYGTPNVIAVKSLNPRYPPHRLYILTAAAEQLSEHPLGKAVVACQAAGEPLPKADSFEMVPGRGVCAFVEGCTVLAGNLEMMAEHRITFPADEAVAQFLDQGCTVIYIGINGEAAGCIVLSDTLREESSAMVSALKQLSVEPVLLTGDSRHSAAAIASQLAIREVHANCLPEDKLRYIQSCQENRQPICMMGDGINDAPALKCATVGIAMGGVGSDIAVDAADIVLVDDEVKELPHLIALSRRMMKTIRLNLTFSMGLNFLAIALAMAEVLTPVTGALVHNAGSVIVILHSALLLTYRRKGQCPSSSSSHS